MDASYVKQFKDKSQYKAADPNNKFWANDESRFGLKVSNYIENKLNHNKYIYFRK